MLRKRKEQSQPQQIDIENGSDCLTPPLGSPSGSLNETNYNNDKQQQQPQRQVFFTFFSTLRRRFLYVFLISALLVIAWKFYGMKNNNKKKAMEEEDHSDSFWNANTSSWEKKPATNRDESSSIASHQLVDVDVTVESNEKYHVKKANIENHSKKTTTTEDDGMEILHHDDEDGSNMKKNNNNRNEVKFRRLPKLNDANDWNVNLDWNVLKNREAYYSMEEVKKTVDLIDKHLKSTPSLTPSSSIRVLVFGQKPIIKRDFKLLSTGYNSNKNENSLFVFLNGSTFKTEETNLNAIVQEQKIDFIMCLTLGSCVREESYEKLWKANPNLIINRVPGLRNILWSKHAFCTSVNKQILSLVSFPCWVLPDRGMDLLKVANKDGKLKTQYIAKPYSSGGGKGIFLISTLQMLAKVIGEKKKLVIQPYLMSPLLINRKKWDLRCYVLLTSASPLRAYVHERGLVRFASELHEIGSPLSGNADFDSITTTTTKQANKTQFLTNTSINKKNGSDASANTWSFAQLWTELGWEKSKSIRLSLDRSVASLLLSVENNFEKKKASCLDNACFHLLGVDVIIDNNLISRVIEVNGEPSFASSSGLAHYDETKTFVARDIAKMVFASHSKTPTLPAALLEERNYHYRYVYHLFREHLVLDETSFRPIYPSPITLVSENHNKFYREVIAHGFNKHKQDAFLMKQRLLLHEFLNTYELPRFVECKKKKKPSASPPFPCSGGRFSLMQDLVL